ncbi:MAG: VWA domain-containing protein [Terracidiphilus sp.]
MKSSILLPGVLLILLCPALFVAQDTPPAPAQTPTLSITSRLVVVDVVVRDSHGKLVHGLTQQDFNVLEDGKPQSIDTFDVHAYDAAAAAAVPPPPAGNLAFSNIAEEGTVSGAINIVLFDLLNTPGSDQIYARRQMLKFLQALPPGQRVALFVLTSNLQMLQGFTGSSDLLAAAAKMLDPKDFHFLRSQTQQMLEADNLQRMADALGGRDAAGIVDRWAVDIGREDAINADNRARITLGALAELARATAGYPGRKNLLWLSASFPLAVGAWMENSPNPYAGEDVAHSNADMHDILETDDLMASAQIAVYPISVLGTQIEDVGAESNGTAETNAIGAVGHRVGTDREGQFSARQIQRYAMNDLAEQTGGKAFYGSNDLAGALQQGIQEGSNYYTLSYHPQNPKWNGQLRKIHVDVTLKGASLSYRRGYYALPDAPAATDSRQDLNIALQPETPESTMMRLKAQVELPNEGRDTVRVTANIDAAGVKFTPDAAGHSHAKLLVMLVAFNDGPKQPDAPPQVSGMLNIDLDAGRYQMVVDRGIGFQQALKLTPGKYRLRLGVSDMTNHFIGTLDMPVTVPPPVSKDQSPLPGSKDPPPAP